jgi:transcriptional/translational regulatory protein YebC/TACO1
MFHRRGLIEADKETAPAEERLLEIIAEAGADDLTDAGEQWEIVTEPDTLRAVRKALEEAGVPLASAELTMIPQTTVPVGADRAASVLRLVEALEDLEDVQAVHANFDIPDEVLAEVG